MKNRLAVVLAAGKGTRMKSDTYKVLHKINGISMVEHVLRAVNQANVNRIVTIVGHGAQTVREIIGKQTEFALQEEQLGTGHAVLQAQELIQQEEGNTLVICGDTPLFSGETINQLFEFHEASQAKATILTAIAPDPTGYGRVVRYGDGEVSSIVEHKDATPEQRALTEINTGTYIFDNQSLFEALSRVKNDNSQGEYYLPDVISILKAEGQEVAAHIMDDFDEAIGVNDRLALARATELMTKRINHQHMSRGVTFTNPSSTYIEVDVEVGYDTVIEAGVSLKGNTKIGTHCFIGSHSEIESSELKNSVQIRQSVIEHSTIEEEANIGPFAHIRPNSQIGHNVHIGNFVEVKNSNIAENTKAGHLSYIGDADIGRDVNIGCGTIFVNYDGKRKHRSTIGDQSFVGSGVSIISPVFVGEQAVLAAGSIINEDVPAQSLAIARSKQVIKENYWQKFSSK